MIKGINFQRQGVNFGGDESNENAGHWYGVMFDESSSSADCTRIGETWLHQSLPVHSLMRRCLLNDDGTVNYYLNANDSTKKEDGTAANLDGTDGQVMVEIPEHWIDIVKAGSVVYARVSAVPQNAWRRVPKYYVSAYEAAYDRTNSKLASVCNKTEQYRGGNNSSSWDAMSKSLLGKPVSSISMSAFRTAARKRGTSGESKWNFYTFDAHCDLYWLFVIEYATRNSQKAFNAALDANMFRQGGLGNGVTTLSDSKWSTMNSYNPFVDCGTTNNLGNNTGVVTIPVPFAYDTAGESNYKGEYDAATEYNADEYVSDGESLYKAVATSTGQSLDDTDYFTPVTRTTVAVPSWHGIENPFGHIAKWIDGIKFTDQHIYEANSRSDYSSATNSTGYTDKGTKGSSNGYISKMFIGDNGSVIPTAAGGGSTTYYCDYYYQANTAGTWYGLYVGGGAYYGASAGFSYANTNSSVSGTGASIGSRLCFFNE